MEIDLGSGVLVGIREVVQQIRELIPGAPVAEFGSMPDRVSESVRVADLETARKTLDWRPVTPLRDGLSRTIEWYRGRVLDETRREQLEELVGEGALNPS
jgi:nucleoside-diphosphate-sugar epimerase